MAFHSIDAAGRLPSLCVEIDVTNAPTNVTRVWTDVTTDIRSLTYRQAGRNDELQRTSPGTLAVVFNNRASKYDPTYGSGVGIRRRQWIRVRAQWSGVTYARWQGVIETIRQSWPGAGHDAVATVTASDAMKVANLYDLAGTTRSAEVSSARFTALVTLTGQPSSVADTGVSTLSALAALSTGTYATSQLQEIEQSENGQVFADPSGNLVFQSRHYRVQTYATPVDTIGDNAGEIPYADLEVDSDDAYIFNKVRVTPTNDDGSAGTVQVAQDTTSQANNWTSVYDRTIRVSSTTEALACAGYLIGRYSDPDPRVPAVTLLGERATTKWPSILSAVYGSRFTVKRRATNTFSQDCHVEQITETVVPGARWETTFQLSPAIDQAGWVLGDAVNGLLGQTTILSY